jgi:hypothetical protein
MIGPAGDAGMFLSAELLERVSDGVATPDADRQLTSVNSAACWILDACARLQPPGLATGP